MDDLDFRSAFSYYVIFYVLNLFFCDDIVTLAGHDLLEHFSSLAMTCCWKFGTHTYNLLSC